MDVHIDCIPCITRQVLEVAQRISREKDGQEVILRKAMQKLLDTKWNITSPEIANEVHSMIRKMTGINDPYKEIKQKSNFESQKIVGTIKDKIDQENNKDEKLRMAILIAIAGNIIDIGPSKDFDVNETINEFLEKKIQSGDYKLLLESIYNSDNLLYFGDNAGEIAFDKLLLETMLEVREKPFKKISFVIKGGPTVNDATEEDAKFIGLDRIENLKLLKISNGEDGTGPKENSEEVKKWLCEHQLIISDRKSVV